MKTSYYVTKVTKDKCIKNGRVIFFESKEDYPVERLTLDELKDLLALAAKEIVRRTV